MASTSKKWISANAVQSNKSQNIGTPSNTDQEDLVWVDTSNKTSWVWKHFKLANNGKTYCFYVEATDGIEVTDSTEKTCNFSCAYNSQTSSMNYHLNTAHKIYEKKKMVCINK